MSTVTALAAGREVRRCLRTCPHGVLSTISRHFGGYPYGSAVPYVLDHAASPVILVSGLAEHIKNLHAGDEGAPWSCFGPAAATGPFPFYI